MSRKFSVYGQVTEPTRILEVGLSPNVSKSERLSQLTADSMYELFGRCDGNVWIDKAERKMIAEVPTGLVFQNDDCRILRARFYKLFNRNRSLQRQAKHSD